MEQGKSLLVGLTGQTGAGKSIVSKLLLNKGYQIIDADIVARQVVAKGKKCLIDLAIQFGIEILNADGTLNRRRLGDLVFQDKAKRMALNNITFPYIQEEIFEQVEHLREAGEPVVFLDAPTLIESGTHESCDRVVSIIAPAEVRLSRVMSRDLLTEQEAKNRMHAQHDDKFYTSHSHFVIENSGDLSELRVKVMEMLDALGIPLKNLEVGENNS